MGLKYLRKFQLGRESTAGTPVAATTVWRGLGAIEDQMVRKYSEVNIGILARYDSGYNAQYLASPIFDSVEATYEQLFHIFEAGIKTVSATADGSGYVYTYPFPTTAANTIKTYTIEGGDDSGEEEVEYCFVSEFNLSGKPGEAWMIDATWLGRQVTVSTFTAGQSVPTTEDILFSKTKLYIDAIGGSYGGTLKSNTLLEANLKVVTGWVPVFTADGALYFSFNKCVLPEVALEVTFEHDATSVAQKANWRAGTSVKLALIAQGAALASAGSYTYKTLKISLPGSWEMFDKLDEQDGNDIVKGTFRCAYNATAGDAGTIVLVNEVASVP